MPRTPTIYLNKEDWYKLEKLFKVKGYPSKYAYIKDLIVNDLNKYKEKIGGIKRYHYMNG